MLKLLQRYKSNGGRYQKQPTKGGKGSFILANGSTHNDDDKKGEGRDKE